MSAWPFHLRRINASGSPVSCSSDPGPIEWAKRRAQQWLEESDGDIVAVEICRVRVTDMGTYTGPRVGIVSRQGTAQR